jgi:DNA repair photolyase
MSSSRRPAAKGRGAREQVANPYLAIQHTNDFEQVADDQEYLDSLSRPATVYLPDDSQSLVSENDSPDVGFRWSVNPYRGCSHGCSYCYARPTHEYLGMSAGVDFETRVLVKHRAPELFRDWLARPAWTPQWISFSGVTDCYQPAEHQFELTRGCLAVAAECRQPIGIVTKNALVTRDRDHLSELAAHGAVCVFLSMTTLDAGLARQMEPRTSSPAARLRTIEQLTAVGIPTGVMVAPVIPGLNDSEIPNILASARRAGATRAGYVLLRLPGSVRPVFMEWLTRVLPAQAEKVTTRIRAARDGKLSDTKFCRRQRGTGPIAEQIRQTFDVFTRRLGFELDAPALNTSAFRPPRSAGGQTRLF